MSSEDATQQTVLVVAGARSWSYSSEWCRLGSFTCVLFPVVHLLHELLRFLLVDERQGSHAVL